VRLLADELLDPLLDGRDARHAADKDDVVDLVGTQVRVLQRLLDRPDDTFEQVVRELVELRPREREVEVLGAVLVGRDERQIDVRAGGRRELDLRLLGGLVQTLQGHLVLAQVDALTLLELSHHPVHDGLVEVVSAEVRVSVGRLYLEHALTDVEDRDVERAATEVEDEDGLVVLLVEAVRQRRRRGLVDDALDVQPGDLAGVFGGLALRVVEVRRDGYHGFGHLLAEIVFGVALQLLQDHRRDLRRRVGLPADLDDGIPVRRLGHLVRHDLHLFRDVAVLAPHEALDGEDRVLGVRDRLATGNAAHEPLARL